MNVITDPINYCTFKIYFHHTKCYAFRMNAVDYWYSQVYVLRFLTISNDYECL